MRNWAGNLTFTPDTLLRPTTVDALRELVTAHPRIHALGTAHSFSPVAEGVDALVTVADLPRVVEVNHERATATVSAGIRWGELAPILHAGGLALPNMGSLPHISVAGSAATGTHGSGDANQCLAAAVSGIELVTATGELRRFARGDADFAGLVVSLGAVGIVTSMTLDLVPTFEVRQWVYDDVSWPDAIGQLDAIFASGYSVSLFTGWTEAGIDQVWVKERVEAVAGRAWSGGTRADGARHPVPLMSADHCTEQGGVPGPWFERLPHFRLDFTPSSGAELQTEYLIPREHAVAAIEAMREIADQIKPVLQISELRSVAADDLWLSPCYGRDSLALHFTWIADTAAVLPVVRAVEQQLAPFHPRPHWGKVFALDGPVVAAGYERLADFRRVADALDPHAKFSNPFTDRYLRADPALPR